MGARENRSTSIAYAALLVKLFISLNLAERRRIEEREIVHFFNDFFQFWHLGQLILILHKIQNKTKKFGEIDKKMFATVKLLWPT